MLFTGSGHVWFPPASTPCFGVVVVVVGFGLRSLVVLGGLGWFVVGFGLRSLVLLGGLGWFWLRCAHFIRLFKKPKVPET